MNQTTTATRTDGPEAQAYAASHRAPVAPAFGPGRHAVESVTERLAQENAELREKVAHLEATLERSTDRLRVVTLTARSRRNRLHAAGLTTPQDFTRNY